jgi:hypothetical protein
VARAYRWVASAVVGTVPVSRVANGNSVGSIILMFTFAAAVSSLQYFQIRHFLLIILPRSLCCSMAWIACFWDATILAVGQQDPDTSYAMNAASRREQFIISP